MLRRIKKDVEHELTEKVEVLVYCPLTIRQKLLYTGLKQNIRMEVLLAGLGLGSASIAPGAGVSNLMNLVMQFRKVCNHPELFERREPKSALVFNINTLVFPKLPYLEKVSSFAQNIQFNIFRADYVQNCQKKVKKSSEFLEVSESPFSFLHFVDISPQELENQHRDLFYQYLLVAKMTEKYQMHKYNWSKETSDQKIRFPLPPPSSCLPSDLIFTSYNSNFLSHEDVTIKSCPETISHRLIRFRDQNGIFENEKINSIMTKRLAFYCQTEILSKTVLS